MMNKKLKINKVLLLLVIIYFSCNSFVLAIKFENQASVIMLVVTAFTCLLALVSGRHIVSIRVINIILVMTFNILLTMIFTGFMNAYILLGLNFLLVLAIIKLMSRQEFFEAYIVAIKILSVFAIVVGLINILTPSLLGGFPLYAHKADYYYRDVFLAFQSVTGFRINGIWGEPGMFSVYLMFALIFECFFVQREIKMVNFSLFTIAIFLAFSTNGLVLLAMVIAILILDNRRNSPKVFIGLFILIFAAIYAVNHVDWISEQIIYATNKLDSSDISFAGRLAPVLYNIEKGFSSPIWGHGIQSEKFFVDYSFYSGFLICNTSTTTFLFSIFGVVFCFCTIYLTWKVSTINCSGNRFIGFLLFLVMMFNVNTQAVHLDQIYYLILFSFFMDDKTELQENKIYEREKDKTTERSKDFIKTLVY